MSPRRDQPAITGRRNSAEARISSLLFSPSWGTSYAMAHPEGSPSGEPLLAFTASNSMEDLMGGTQLHRLAQGLEWLGSELEHYRQEYARAGSPTEGPAWDAFLRQQRGVLTTADKIERELKAAIGFNPKTLLGVEYPLEEAFDLVTELLGAVEEIRQAAHFSADQVAPKVRSFTRMLQTYLNTIGAPSG